MCNTKVFFFSSATLFVKQLILAYKYITRSNCVNKTETTETKQKQRPTSHGMDQLTIAIRALYTPDTRTLCRNLMQ